MSLAITFREAAERLHVSESTVRRAVSSGDLVAVRIGAARRIRNEDLVVLRRIANHRRGKP